MHVRVLSDIDLALNAKKYIYTIRPNFLMSSEANRKSLNNRKYAKVPYPLYPYFASPG